MHQSYRFWFGTFQLREDGWFEEGSKYQHDNHVHEGNEREVYDSVQWIQRQTRLNHLEYPQKMIIEAKVAMKNLTSIVIQNKNIMVMFRDTNTDKKRMIRKLALLESQLM